MGACPSRSKPVPQAAPPRRAEPPEPALHLEPQFAALLAAQLAAQPPPQPAPVDTTVTELQPHTLLLPKPPLKMPFELSLGSEPDWVRPSPNPEFPCLYALPVYFRAEVRPLTPDAECFLVATLNCRVWGLGGDGLTAYGSVNRGDFTFRSQVFGGFPRAQVHARQSERLLKMGQWNEMAMVLSERKATYWINEKMVATCRLSPGDLPAAEVYLGLISYRNGYEVRGFDVTREPLMIQHICSQEDMIDLGILKQKILTLTCRRAGATGLVVFCDSLAGEHVATFPVGMSQMVQADMPFWSFRLLLQQYLQLPRHHDLRLVLADGTLLTEKHDSTPLFILLGLDPVADKLF
eukprot:Skav224341  [mRNA]  locus=scaffold2411:24096:26202:- [translate_table: standard]